MTNLKQKLALRLNPTRFGASHFRRRLAFNDALPQISFLGFVSGVAAALVIVAFRSLFEIPLEHWLPGGTAESFEQLDPIWYFFLPVMGGLLIGLWLMLFAPNERKAGVAHVMDRMAYHQAKMPFKNTLVQFVGGALAILTGQSAGREGPAVHLGSAVSSQLASAFHLPNNSVRLMVGCGTAGAIAASFNTPMAGVIFAMEVVMLEYSIMGFTPVIIAAVTATLLHNTLYGAEMAFMAADIVMVNMNEMPLILVYGVVLGAMAALFTKTVTSIQNFAAQPVLARMLIAGIFTGSLAYFVPQVMGMGTDSILLAIEGQYALGLLVALALAKLFATAISVGLGMPIGLIGPTLLMGACAGSALGHISSYVLDGPTSDAGFYAMLGMGAMMSAVLQAPLAALIGLMELTHNPGIILPGMATIVIANISCSYFFKQDSVFIEVLRKQGLDYQANPITQALNHQGVTSLMHDDISHHYDDDIAGYVSATDLGVNWLIINSSDHQVDHVLHQSQISLDGDPSIGLIEAAGSPKVAFGFCSSRATLKEAWDLCKKRDYKQLLITDVDGSVMGLLPVEEILKYTQKD
jgi:CIC family chloride channel protein|tara:strand:- start:1990 stop:3726 length:1737 start_codon:yes stop_codon:yes gene_type:complete